MVQTIYYYDKTKAYEHRYIGHRYSGEKTVYETLCEPPYTGCIT